MDTADTSLLGERQDFFNEKVPCLDLSIVEHRSILVLPSLSISAVADTTSSLFIEVVKEQVLELAMVTTGRDPSQAVNDDFDAFVLSLLDDLQEVSFTAKHLAWGDAISHSKRRCVCLAILCALVAIALISVAHDLNVVSLEDTHQIEGRDALLFVGTDRPFDILESATSCEGLVLKVEFGILVVDLDFMEAVIAHASSMHNESSLCEWAIILVIIHVVALIDGV